MIIAYFRNVFSPRGDIAAAVPDNLTPIEVHRGPATLYQVTNDSGSLEIKELGKAPLSQESLNTGDCFVIDAAAANKIFVWKGNFKFEVKLKIRVIIRSSKAALCKNPWEKVKF